MLIDSLKTCAEPDRLAGGPSCAEVGAVLDSQDAALRLYALREVLGLWEVVTPAKMHISGAEWREFLARGFLVITGFRPGD